jgi:hypothetical protein
VCVCSLSNPACKAHAPHYYLWPAHLYHIFNHLIHSTIFGKKLLNIKCVFWFSLQLLSEIFLIPRRILWHTTTNLHWSSRNLSIILVKFYWNLNFLGTFTKIIKYKISWKSVQWQPSTLSSMQTDRQTDRHTIKITVTFPNYANMQKNGFQHFEGTSGMLWTT